MNNLLLFTLVLCVHSSYQQLNRQQQTHSLTYADSDFNPLPPVTRTTTVPTTTTEPESTTKKKGFFSGITGFFKSKDKTTETTTSTTTQRTTATTKKISTTTTTVKSVVTLSTVKTPINLPASSTPKVLSSSVSTPTPRPVVSQNPTVPTGGSQRPTKDDFPALPTHPTLKPSDQQHPAVPNAWGVSISTPAPAQNPWKKPSTPSTPIAPTPPNAWNKPPQSPSSGPPQSFFPQSPSTTKRPQSFAPTTQSTVGSGPATDAELLTLSESLFSKDINNPFKHVVVNYQGRTYSSSNTDEAPQPMLKIDEDKLFALTTVEKMKAMYNNYEQDTSINEYVSPIEKKEEDEFIEAVLATPVMRHAMNFLTQKNIVTPDPETHRELLKTIWFNLYSRGSGKIGSSGFEHVFLSEVKNGTVMGLHNWIYMSVAEKNGDLDYKGWTKKIDLGNKGQIAKVRFVLNNLGKPSNSLFIGTSPELELALYTVCFELRADKDCRLSYGGKDFNIVTHSYRYRGKNLIGSAYPEI